MSKSPKSPKSPKSRKLATLFTSLALLAAPAASRAAGPTPPAEVAQTVAAFTGRWVLDGTEVLPGSAPKKARMKLDCTTTALGRGVVCLGTGSSAGTGPWQGAFLIGYDMHTGRVHVMAVTSDESVHDHLCTWKTKTELACDPLKASMGGKPITEDLGFIADTKTLTLKVAVHLEDGSRVTFEVAGKRR
jgi:hypothetical protein